jgi:PE family
MTLLSIAPDIVAGASGELEDLGSALRSANAAAASQTTWIAAPAADEVSAAITALLGTHAQGFQALSAKAAAFHDDFVNSLSGGARHYVGTEAANAQQAGAAAAITGQSYSGKFGPVQYSVTETATTLNANVTLDVPLRPSLSLNATSTSIGGTFNAAGAFHTPLGSLNWLTADGSVITNPGGAVSASLNAHSPFAPPLTLSVNETPTSTGGTFNATGSFKTPLGSVNWLTAAGSVIINPDGAVSVSISEHTLFGPPGTLSLSATPVINDTEVGEVLNATGTFKTPLGPVTWLTANGSASITPDGVFQASLSAHIPGKNDAVSVTGIVAPSGTLQITGGSVSIDGIKFSF